MFTDSRPHYGLHQAPCIDRCADLRSAEANLLALRNQGAVLKLDYVKEGSKQHNPNMVGLYLSNLFILALCHRRPPGSYIRGGKRMIDITNELEK